MAQVSIRENTLLVLGRFENILRPVFICVCFSFSLVYLIFVFSFAFYFFYLLNLIEMKKNATYFQIQEYFFNPQINFKIANTFSD